jgi:hypothetical protein
MGQATSDSQALEQAGVRRFRCQGVQAFIDRHDRDLIPLAARPLAKPNECGSSLNESAARHWSL